MNAYTIAQKLIEEKAPSLWRKCYPRCYDNLGNFFSPKIPATCLANAVVAARGMGLNEPGFSNQYVIAALNDRHDVPTFFVKNALLQSVNQTTLPGDLKWVDIPMPHPGMVFMFEKGAVKHPEMGNIAFAACARPQTGELIDHSWDGDGQPPPSARMMTGGFMMMTAGHESELFDCVDLSMNEENSPTIASLQQASQLDRDLSSPFVEALSVEEKEWNKWLTELCIKLIMVMNARPEIVSHGSLQRTIKKGNSLKNEFWTPNVIGRNYEAQREEHEPTGKKLRLHWRKGHIARQPHGPHNSLRKTIWREPVLVWNPEEK